MAEDMNFEVDDHERRHLADLARHPGYRVLKLILRAWLDAKIAEAVQLSRINPLANSDAIAHAWAEVKVAEDMVARLEQGITFELGVLFAHEKPKPSPAESAARRRHVVLGELDPYTGDDE